MKYPRRSPYLIYRRYGNEYIVEDWISSEKYRMDPETVQFLKHLDGKHDPSELLPDCSREQVAQFMEELDDCNMLAPKKKVLILMPGFLRYPLIYCYPNRLRRKLAEFWNLYLTMMFIPMMGIGFYLHNHVMHAYRYSKGDLYLGMILGGVLGIAFHEISHTCAGLAYGAHLFEIGVGTHCFIPMGYVMLEDKNVKNRSKRIQIDAAGVEMNMLLYGFFMSLEAAGYFNPRVMYLCGLINLTMAIINLLPLRGLDGMKILSVIMGKDDILECAKNIIRSRKKYLRRHNCNAASIAAVTVSYGFVGFQIILPILMVVEVISLVRLILL